MMDSSDTLCQEASTNGLGAAADTCPRTLVVEAPTAPETGRTATRGPCSIWMVMQAAGIRKATEPSTHMIAPAAAWSSSAVIAVSRGAVAYVGESTRSQKVRKAARMVFCTSARKRYGISTQRGPCGRLGQGWSTGHQNRRAVATKHRCSTSCQPGVRRASSYKAGTCHAVLVTANASEAVHGTVR